MKNPQSVNAHAGSVSSSLSAASAWRLACFALLVGIVVVGVSSMKNAGVQRTVIVPYGRFSANSFAKVTGDIEQDSAYLTLLARADISALLDWQPRTVAQQIGAFLTRLTPSAYGRFNVDLMNKAQKYAEMNSSETFYLQRIEFVPPSSIVMEGALERYAGSERELTSDVKYKFTYAQSNGVYALDNVETPK